MGISGLLPLLKSVQNSVHLSELSGKVIAVDAYVWLHRGVCSCATELATGEPTTKYVEYAMQRVRLLQHHNITPYLVFDGGPLPAKRATEIKRQRKRKESLAVANSLAKQGKHRMAREHYLKAVDVTPQMAFQFIKALRSHGITYVVAPYEADAQMIYLESLGLVDGILTEDSDLLVFGAKFLYLKLDTTNSSCMLIRSDTLASNTNSDFPLHGWGLKELRHCAMLNGCDYLEGIPGVGLKTASRYLRKWRTIEKTLRALRMNGKPVEKDWESRMNVAEVGFLHQRVWDPLDNKIVYLSEPDPETWSAEREIFVGKYIESDLAAQIARGDVDPTTLKAMIDIFPSYRPDNKATPLRILDCNRFHNRDAASQPSILRYFQKQAVLPAEKLPSQKCTTGKNSGKRTLVEEYEREVSIKRHKLGATQVPDNDKRSKFFGNVSYFSESTAPMVSHDHKENIGIPTGGTRTDGDPYYLHENTGCRVQELLNDSLIQGNGSDKDSISELSSPLQRIGVPSRTASQSQKNYEGTSRGGVVRNHAQSPNSSDGRITSPPSSVKNLGKSRSRRKTTTGIDNNDDVFTVDLKDAFSEEDVTSWIKSPALPEYLDGIADEDVVEDDLQRRHRLVAEGWKRRFARTTHTQTIPCQPLQRMRTL